MKYGKFRKVEFSVSHTHSYGHYRIEANYRGKHIRAIMTNSEAYDDMDSDNRRERMDALRYIYGRIVDAYC